MKQIIVIFKKQPIVVIFFLFLVISLFLGDGKQPFVDAWWALGILTIYGVRYYQRGKLDLRPLPRTIGYAWSVLILYYIVRIPFSDSAGYSITATVRLLEAYLLFILFYTISSERLITLFSKGLIMVGAVAILASWVFIAFPSSSGFLPLMNLLYATYGHNHLADLLLPIFPLVIAKIQHKPSKLSWFLFVFYVVGMVFTFARGAWILLILYLLYIFLGSVKGGPSRYKSIVLITATLFIVIFVGISFYSMRFPQSKVSNFGWFSRQLVKPALTKDNRLKYWKQAAVAIGERPWFGSGPGTFYLQSKRLQDAPSSFSWFAHSFPLQTTVETGVAGLLIFAVLFYFLFRGIQAAPPLLLGIILALAYSFYEFTLDYTVMWLLVWAILGVLVKNDDWVTGRSRNNELVNATALAVVALYYLTSIGSAMALAIINNSELAFRIAPYNTETTREYVKEAQKLQNIDELRPAIWFHRRNPEVIFAQAQVEEDLGNLQTAAVMYKDAIVLDPYGFDYYDAYFRLLLETEKSTSFVKELLFYSWRLLPTNVQSLLRDAEAVELIEVRPLELEEFYRVTSGNRSLVGYLARVYYFLGLDVLSSSRDAARIFWTISKEIDPMFSFYHVELASFHKYILDDVDRAKTILKDCMSFIVPRQHCEDIAKSERYNSSLDLPSVGFYRDVIRKQPIQ
ncbi:O-antigen ligase family protein [Candidatus Gottesmanbacteria bacterium]|nr:O-antigen ligase family protein [Candidatus Gottesmanbacteria bacterium]